MLEKNKDNGQTLIEEGIKPELPKDFLRHQLQSNIRMLREKGLEDDKILQNLYPNTILDTGTLEALTAALIAGNNVLLFGPPGSGKTNLAKDIWEMFPKKNFVVDECPVQDNPFSIFDSSFFKKVPACPFCKTRFGELSYSELGYFDPSKVDPKTVPVAMVTLREGHGLARIQGSPEVFPDNLTGTLNLQRLERIGDPTSPLVLEPGKLLQANRGLLMVDEIGKLPRGTQNVLLQALQEHIVSPAKSRETFPGSFIAICTSNLDDLDNINEPLNDRLSNIHVNFNKLHPKNRKIIDLALAKSTNEVFIPEVFLEGSVFVIEGWRNASGEVYELSEVGSNRTMIDIITRSEAYTNLQERRMVSLTDFEKGTISAMLGRIRARGGDSLAQNEDRIYGFISKNLQKELMKAGRMYWCGFYKDVLNEDKPEGKRTLEECQKILKNPELAKGALKQDSSHKKYRKFGKFVVNREHHIGNLSNDEVVLSIFGLLSSLDVFECDESEIKLKVGK
ncbi:MAG: ATP-binding protein [Methanomassiliicoccales archaeon]|nr:MAG: ATP-binding protein [Methanomassiliicoccales archaeon]